MPLYAKPPSREEGAVTLKWICKTSSGSSNLLPPASDKQTSEDKVITISKLPWKTLSADELSIGEHHSAHLSSEFCWHLLSLGLSLSNSSKSLQMMPWEVLLFWSLLFHLEGLHPASVSNNVLTMRLSPATAQHGKTVQKYTIPSLL